jgi:hypothetical protein
MEPTMDTLPHEGETRIVTEVLTRVACSVCGEPAHFRHTYVLPGARSNPASKGYRMDDISWCADAEQFSCRDPQHFRDMQKSGMVDGRPYDWCATFPAIERFAHMFIQREIKEVKVG